MKAKSFYPIYVLKFSLGNSSLLFPLANASKHPLENLPTVPMISPLRDFDKLNEILLDFYLITGRAARLQQFGMMPTTIKALIMMKKINQIDQKFPTSVATEAARMPCDMFTSSGGKNSQIPGKLRLLTLKFTLFICKFFYFLFKLKIKNSPKTFG